MTTCKKLYGPLSGRSKGTEEVAKITCWPAAIIVTIAIHILKSQGREGKIQEEQEPWDPTVASPTNTYNKHDRPIRHAREHYNNSPLAHSSTPAKKSVTPEEAISVTATGIKAPDSPAQELVYSVTSHTHAQSRQANGTQRQLLDLVTRRQAKLPHSPSHPLPTFTQRKHDHRPELTSHHVHHPAARPPEESVAAIDIRNNSDSVNSRPPSVNNTHRGYSQYVHCDAFITSSSEVGGATGTDTIEVHKTKHTPPAPTCYTMKSHSYSTHPRKTPEPGGPRRATTKPPSPTTQPQMRQTISNMPVN